MSKGLEMVFFRMRMRVKRIVLEILGKAMLVVRKRFLWKVWR